MKEISRNKLQELTADAIYAILTYRHMGEDIDVEAIFSSIFETDYAEVPVYAKTVVIATLRHLGEEVALLEKNMRRWKFERLNRVEQAILLLSLSNFFYNEEKPDKKIVISVAVNLAHQYLDATDYKFVNAILDKVLVRDE